MADASYAIPHFLGGEISQFAQGRFDKPDYRVSLNVCLNGLPNEIGSWVRRPGTQYGGTTRGGAAARVVKFDFEQANAVTLEFTDGKLRFRNGTSLISTNDAVGVTAVSAAVPAVLQVGASVNWASGDTVVLRAESTPLLENRQFLATRVDSTHFALADAITGNAIDGSTLGAIAVGADAARIQEVSTPYIGGSWAAIRAVQAETTDILLSPGTAPQALTVTVPPPSVGTHPLFALSRATFNDGPYLDPFTNGVQAVPGGTIGIVTLQISFPAYDNAKAYAAGAFVTAGGTNYVSLIDQNVNQAVSNPAAWAATSASAAINGGQGFLGSDIGRQVRLLSEPAAWAVGSTYAMSATVAYNPSGQPGASTYYQSLIDPNTGHAPGADLTSWKLIPQGAAIWTWGKITSLSNIIDRALAGSTPMGDMSGGGGVAAAFDGVFSQANLASARASIVGADVGPGGHVALSSYVGKDFTGAGGQRIQQVTIYPSNDSGIAFGSYAGVGLPGGGATVPFAPTIIINLRGKTSAIASGSDGVLLGTTGTITNTLSSITIPSSDQVTVWSNVWVEILTDAEVGDPTGASTYSLFNAVGELSFFAPAGTGTSSGVNVEILGSPLLYTNPVATWRLGVYSDTTGWPTCGCYHDGRLWLGGAVSNRFDGSMSNGIVPGGSVVNFAPTDQYGAVAANNGVSETINSDSTNPIFWMKSDLQGVKIGTQAGEFMILAPTTGSIAPNNITSRPLSHIGSANIEPCRTEHTSVFVQRYRRKLSEFFADAYSGKFTGPNLADKAAHLVGSGVAELAYTSAVTPVIWGRCDDGSLFGVTYKRDTLTTAQPPTFAGFHRHTLGSGRVVESICAGPSTGGDLDTLTMVTNDPATGIRHVEVLTDMPGETATLEDCRYLDDAVSPSSVVSTTIPTDDAPYGSLTLNGLWHLNSKTVQVFITGLDCGDRGPGTDGFTDFVVTNGSVVVPYGDGLSAGPGQGILTADFLHERGLITAGFVTVFQTDAPPPFVVGCTYDSDGQLVRPIAPADSGARTGPALGATSRIHQYALLLSNSRGLEISVNFDKMWPVPMKGAGGADIDVLATYSGVVRDSLECDYSYESMLAWRVSRPFPANIVAVSGKIQTQG